MDKAVLDAYGWSDLPTDCEFLLDYEIDEEEWGKKKKPDRYRWPDDVRDEFLARLLELKAERAKETLRELSRTRGRMPTWMAEQISKLIASISILGSGNGVHVLVQAVSPRADS